MPFFGETIFMLGPFLEDDDDPDARSGAVTPLDAPEPDLGGMLVLDFSQFLAGPVAANGYLAIAMNPVPALGDVLGPDLSAHPIRPRGGATARPSSCCSPATSRPARPSTGSASSTPRMCGRRPCSPSPSSSSTPGAPRIDRIASPNRPARQEGDHR